MRVLVPISHCDCIDGTLSFDEERAARQPGESFLHLKAPMTKSLRSLQVTTLALCSLFATAGMAGRAATAQDATPPADNSAHNKHHAKTADNQPDAQADRLTTANIRKAIIADKGLSTYAHNVKIITRDGAVTLKGPVKSDDEKQKVASAAATVVSQDKIVDQLTVKQ